MCTENETGGPARSLRPALHPIRDCNSKFNSYDKHEISQKTPNKKVHFYQTDFFKDRGYF
jgi:hypothetical protein